MSINKVLSLIENKVEIGEQEEFAAIIGANPSQGARSPKLWNSAFKSIGCSARMYPFDVKLENLDSLLNELKNTDLFIGGAVAVPHKISTANFLGSSITQESKKIGAVNCLFKDENNLLTGTNTDGEAARISLINEVQELTSKKILILGAGGAGKAVASYISDILDESQELIIAVRNYQRGVTLQSKISNAKLILWEDISSHLLDVNIIINCTTVGSIYQKDSSPLSSEQISITQDETLIFDIIYQPLETQLLKLARLQGRPTLNGLSMNLEQAVLAFNYALGAKIKGMNIDTIRTSMSNLK